MSIIVSLGFNLSQSRVVFTVVFRHWGQEDQSHEPYKASCDDSCAQDGKELVNWQEEYQRYQKLKVVP